MAYLNCLIFSIRIERTHNSIVECRLKSENIIVKVSEGQQQTNDVSKGRRTKQQDGRLGKEGLAKEDGRWIWILYILLEAASAEACPKV